jgi:AcrR family transcriptional regulator
LIDRYPRTTSERERTLSKLDPATRARIEAAALELFSEREFHRVKLINIARDARISLQTLYKYYGSKKAVLFASLDTWLSEMATRLIDHLQGIENFEDRLRKAFWVLLDYFERNPKVAQIILSSVYLGTWGDDETFRQPALMSVFLGVINEGRARGILTREVDEIEISDFIWGVANRTVGMWLLRGRKTPLAAKAPAMFNMVWRAIASEQVLAEQLLAHHSQSPSYATG